MSEKLPIIAHGETYAKPVKRNQGGGPRIRPHEYEEARSRLLANIDTISSQIENNPDLYLDERIVCVRLEPKFEAKSYMPSSMLTASDNLKIVGGRKYRTTEERPAVSIEDAEPNDQPKFAKLYFLRATSKGISDFENALRNGTNDTDAWRNEIMSIRSLDLLMPEEKILGFDDDWESGAVEVVLHPFERSDEQAVDLFCKATGLDRAEIEVRTYRNGVTFVAAQMNKEAAIAAARINPLRTMHPMGQVNFEPMIRGTLSAPAPQIAPAREKPPVTVGVFDGGCNAGVPLLKGRVDAHDCVASPAVQAGIDHGSGVCGTILHGELSGKGPNDILPEPEVHVESFRVLPPSNPIDLELYESIDAIEFVVEQNPGIRLYNLSFGPQGPILDDDISRFTYALDIMSFSRDVEPPLFCVAVGNDGDKPEPFNRIQSPSDLINGLGVGAYTNQTDGSPSRAYYSCVGPGREGAKIKPDVLEFGGDLNKPFFVTASSGNKLRIDAGTSFASPLVVHKLGKMMARSEDVTQHLARALLLHNAIHRDDFVQEEYGFGIVPEDPAECLSCENNRVTTLYQGVLRPKQLVSLPIFALGIEGTKGLVTVSWTIVAVCDTDPNDSDAYSASCVTDTFVPHSSRYSYTQKGTNQKKTVDLSTEEGRIQAAQLELEGYSASNLPASKPAKRYWEESDLRAHDLKWDTVISKTQRMQSTSIHEPSLTLQSIFRNNGDSDALTRYYVVVTIEAPGYNGSLYNETLQQFQNLQPIRLRVEQRLETKN
ncbi:MAG: S8 family peptidase [Coriobacteriaceae bacterium]|nr:S8 family peptidase [Coriobacteriaceae bacterium]